jgi:hypothetical protein
MVGGGGSTENVVRFPWAVASCSGVLCSRGVDQVSATETCRLRWPF